MDFRAHPVKSIADFLLYLFQDKKSQPRTIDSYRSAIADKLGNSPINVSKDEDLTCPEVSTEADLKVGGHPLLEPLPGLTPADKGSF